MEGKKSEYINKTKYQKLVIKILIVKLIYVWKKIKYNF